MWDTGSNPVLATQKTMDGVSLPVKHRVGFRNPILVLYSLALIMRRKDNRLHVGSNPTETTTLIPSRV